MRIVYSDSDSEASDNDKPVAKKSQEETKSESKIQYPPNPFKQKYLIYKKDGVDTHSNQIDASKVEYYTTSGTFQVFFDERLFQVPKSVIDLERRLYQIEAESWVQ